MQMDDVSLNMRNGICSEEFKGPNQTQPTNLSKKERAGVSEGFTNYTHENDRENSAES